MMNDSLVELGKLDELGQSAWKEGTCARQGLFAASAGFEGWDPVVLGNQGLVGLAQLGG